MEGNPFLLGIFNRSSRPKALLALAAGIALPPHPAAARAQAPSSDRAALVRRLDALLDTPPLDRAWVGAMVVSLRTGRTWFARNAGRRFAPASNTKLFTTAAALEYLDPERRFETRVVLRRRADSTGSDGLEPNGEWSGDLALVGGGDPSLTDKDLDDMARQVAAAGVRLVHGELLLDETLFRGPGRSPGVGWDWEDEADAAPASALTCDRGRVEVTVTPAAEPGGRPTVALFPEACGLAADVQAITGQAGSKTTLVTDRPHAASTVRVRGRIAAGSAPYRDAVAVDDPADLAGRVFLADLTRAGVKVEGAMRVAEGPAEGREIASHRSEPLRVLLRQMNLPSDNHYAETFLRHVGVEWRRRGGAVLSEDPALPPDTADFGIAAERAMLSRWGIPDVEAHLVDGSGLSRVDEVTPGAIVRLLQQMAHNPRASFYFGSLPVAGRTGTLRRRMIGTAAEGNVAAKTGTLTSVTALSGRVTTRTGEPLLFSLLLNEFSGAAAPDRAIQDRFCEALAEAR